MECEPVPRHHTASSTCSPATCTTSAEKRKAFSSPEIQPTTNSTNVLIKKTRQEELAQNISCSSCLTMNMECVTKQNQIDVSLKFICRDCDFVALDTQSDSDSGNEWFHSRIWRICPKHRNANKPMLDFAAAQAVTIGYVNSCHSSIMGIPRTKALHKILKEQDMRIESFQERKCVTRGCRKSWHVQPSPSENFEALFLETWGFTTFCWSPPLFMVRFSSFLFCFLYLELGYKTYKTIF